MCEFPNSLRLKIIGNKKISKKSMKDLEFMSKYSVGHPNRTV